MSTTTTTTETKATNSTQSSESNLDDLVSQLRQNINKSDWLTHNTSAKWEKENPELAQQWREALKANAPSDTAQSPTSMSDESSKPLNRQ